MVRVPIAPQVEAQVPQGPSGAPQFQAPPMPGMQESQQLAQDIGRAGQMAMDVQRDEQALALYQQRMAAKEKATQDALIAKRQAAIDESMVQQALTVTGSQWDEILDIYGRAKGKAAIDRYQEALSALDAVSKATGDNLPEGLRQAYTMAAMQKQLIARRGINKHFGEQSDAWDTNTKREWIDSLKNDAVAGYDTLDDPSGVYATSMGAAMRAVEQIQAKFGETSNSPATMRFKREIWESVTTQVADNLIRDKDFAGAMKHVEDVAGAGMMSEAQLTKLRDAIETSEANSSALATADNLFERGATGSTKPFEGTTPEPGYEPLPTLPNGDPDIGAMKDVINGSDRDERWKASAISRLEWLESQRKQEASRRYLATLDAATSVAHSQEAIQAQRSNWQQFAEENPQMWSDLSAKDQAALKTIPLASDDGFVNDLYQMVSDGVDPQQIAQRIRQNPASLTPSERSRWLETLSSPDRVLGVTLDEDQFDSILYTYNEDVLSNVANMSGLSGTKKKDASRDRADLRYAWKQRIDLAQRRLGRELADDEKEVELRFLLSDGSKIYDDDREPVGYKWQQRAMQKQGGDALFLIQTSTGPDYVSEEQFRIMSDYMMGAGYEMTPVNIRFALDTLRKAIPKMEKKYD